jgi:MFS family permease
MASSLKHRNYRLFFIGQTISNVGTWMQKVAVSWLIYRITGSVFMLGFATFVGQAPSFFLSPFAGVLADRYPRRTLMIVLQALELAQSVALAALVLFRVAEVWQVLALNCLMGVLNACDLPVRQSFTEEMIGDGDQCVLGNAIALNSTMVNLAKLVGPTLAGSLLLFTNEGFCFLMNAVSYLAVLASLLMMRLPHSGASTSKKPMFEGLRDGMRHAADHAPIRRTLLLLGVVSFFGQPHISLLPAFAREILRGNARTLGLLMGFQGLGAVFGALYLAGQRTTDGIERRIALANFIYGLSLAGFALSRNQALSMLLIALTGFAMMTQMAGSNTLLQTQTGAEMRGRIMSFYAVAVMGVMPIGSLAAGEIASHIGPSHTVAVGAIVCTLAGLLYRRTMRERRYGGGFVGCQPLEGELR